MSEQTITFPTNIDEKYLCLEYIEDRDKKQGEM